MTPQQRLATREFFGIKLGLDTMRALIGALDHPERSFLPIIVAGTNGKGSVTAMVARALRAAGLRTGRYTSPHLTHLTERFAIDDRDVDDEALDAALAAVFEAEERLLAAGALPGPATYFELTTAAAFVIFRAAGVRVAVVEVGLGGRHDATNVVEAPWAAITSIGMDHMAQLGNTLALIAAEKAGVIMPGATVVSGVTEDEPATVIAETCAARAATLIRAGEQARLEVEEDDGDCVVAIDTPRRRYRRVRLALRGRHQAANALVAVRLLEALEAAGIGGGAEAIVTGLADARWPGRLERQVMPGGSTVVLDGAHNPAGAEALATWWRSAGFAPATLVTACMRDKDVEGLLRPLLPLADAVIATAVPFARALPAAELSERIAALAPALAVTVAPSPAEAMAAAAERHARVVVAGSLFLVGAAREWLARQGGPSQPA
ncbi:bifunctional folylpolyglutamate synthase/dihydrofolate synthase [Luteitalea sp. TBR-22]|uniref:bifunctional folylpolyglutamate synthase/dihydrofolate synthase n=1 Tax=Luteitalea sp. TBR-22 TaxID=2802971 RepID=UPI001AFB91BF|nr:Mur ligase family protein [Luteitalea sp. TBR-22]BCS35592.1 bifunctional folylpolyglutamate synthase/dihydrofolate synthase [Luteitalea sp. TBR-22]